MAAGWGVVAMVEGSAEEDGAAVVMVAAAGSPCH